MTLLLLGAVFSTSAREVFPLNEGWRFYFKSEPNSDNARHVTLPHSWNTDSSASGYLLETTGNYLNNMYIPGDWADKRLFVRFHGVQSVANLFINGSHVGTHHGGATAFTFEITDKVHFGADNALLMVVSNSQRDDVLPTSTDINLYGGIYREAELILTERTIVSPLYLGTEGVLVHQQWADEEKAEGEIEVHLSSRGSNSCQLHVEVTAPDDQIVMSKQQKVKIDNKGLRIPYSIEEPMLWGVGSPFLYTVKVAVGDENGMTDSVVVRTGLRHIDTEDPTKVKINHEDVDLRGVTLYHDSALSGGTLSNADYDHDLNEIFGLGANALRSAVMPHAQYLYDRCDEHGMLVWIDIPFHKVEFLSDVGYFATPMFEENGLQQLREIVAQNINHPSVIMWGIFSRQWLRGDDVSTYIRRLNDEAHQLDPSRPTVASSDQNGSLNFITNLIVWRQDVGWAKGSPDDLGIWRAQLQKSWSHLHNAIEYGGEGFIGHKSYTAQAEPRSNWKPEERQTRFHEEYARNLQNDSLFWGVWIDNMFDYGSARRPYGLNAQGLITQNRRDKKDAYYLYKAMWNQNDPTLHIVDKHRTLRDNPRQAFSVYSSHGVPTIVIGSDSLEMTEYSRCQYRTDSVELQGRVHIKAWCGDQRDSVTIFVGNALKPRRIQDLRKTIGL